MKWKLFGNVFYVLILCLNSFHFFGIFKKKASIILIFCSVAETISDFGPLKSYIILKVFNNIKFLIIKIIKFLKFLNI